MATIGSNTYGKTRVRLMWVDRTCDPHEVREICVAILFEGEFEAAFTRGDNTALLPTDTMKNTVYVLAKKLLWNSIEALAQGLAQHFLQLLSQLSQVTIEVEQVPWQQLGSHRSAFCQSGNERRKTRLQASRSELTFTSGFTGLQILKTADSGFSGFLKDSLTTLPETDDRLFGTVLEAEWKYGRNDLFFNEAHQATRAALLDCFAKHQSLSVQHTLFAMGTAALDQVDAIASIHLIMPNRHCVLFDLSRFNLENPNQIFVPVDEPSGYIEAHIVR